jgi:hypothetical protein
MRITDLVEMLKPKRDHISFCVEGARGSFKTTHLYGMYDEVVNAGYETIFAYDVEDIDVCDCLFLDDFGTKFYKRDSSTKQNKEFMKLLQEIRTNISVIVASTPDLSLMDKDFRNFFIDAHILRKGVISVSGLIIEVNPPSMDLFNDLKKIEHERRENRFKSVLYSLRAPTSRYK